MNKPDVTLCLKCKFCTGRPLSDGTLCPWVQKFAPVPGWTAKPTIVETYKLKDGSKMTTESYTVSKCPLYAPDANTEAASFSRAEACQILNTPISYVTRHADLTRILLRRYLLARERRPNLVKFSVMPQQDEPESHKLLRIGMIDKLINIMLKEYEGALEDLLTDPDPEPGDDVDIARIRICIDKLKILQKTRNITLKRVQKYTKNS